MATEESIYHVHQVFANTSDFLRGRRQTQFEDCTFSKCDFSASDFMGCDLYTAVFENTILNDVDFSTAFNFTINPERNALKKAKFALSGLPGLLGTYGIVVDEC